jgi:cell division protein FtsN
MKTAPRVAATVAAAAAVGIGLAGPAAASTHAKPSPSPAVSSNFRTVKPGGPGGLFRAIETAIDRLLDCEQEPP